MIDGLSQLLIEQIGNRAGRVLIGVTGIPGSGKSTFAGRLVDRIHARLGGEYPFATVVAMDGFHYSNAKLEARGWRGRKGAPHTFDVDGFMALLARLRAVPAVTVRAPIYDRAIHEPRLDAQIVEARTRLVIVDGNYLLHDEPPWDGVRPWLDEVWYLDTPDDVAMRRVRDRHMAGGLDAEAADGKIAANDLANAAVVKATRERADRIIQPEPSDSG